MCQIGENEMKISVVIPCYGSETTIAGVVEEVVTTLKQRDNSYEIILVNDCSPDNVWKTIQELHAQNKNVKGICLAKNFGQHSALMAGYRYATGDVVVSMDDDGQTPADEIYKLIDKIDEGFDVVYATYGDKRHSWFRNFGSKVNDFMCEKLLGKPKGLMVTSYFAARKFVVKEICRYRNPYTYVIGLIFRTTKSIGMVPVTHRDRLEGSSGYTLSKLLGLWMNGFTAFSVKPLRAATMTGVIFAMFGFVYVFYILINKLMNPAVPIGWSSTIAAVMIVGGVILCMLGMIGEYLGRVYISINDSPQYVIREQTDEE